MINFKYDSYNYKQFTSLIAKAIGGKQLDDFIRIPATLGSGYMWSFELPNGISILVADASFHKDISFKRQPSKQNDYFIIHFNEATDFSQLQQENKELQKDSIAHKAVWLSSLQFDAEYILPARVKITSVKIMLHRSHFEAMMGKAYANEFLGNYFTSFARAAQFAPIDADYREITSQIIKDVIDVPLRKNFIGNRVLLLIEQFIIKTNKTFAATPKSKLRDSEILRLMQAESLLVNDFSAEPPTIQALSRICAMSPTKLKEDFKLLYGMPVYAYYQHNKMIKAKSLLAEGKLSVKEVGIMVGYTNLSHFAAAFKKEFGYNPSEMLYADALIN